jgi:hypothetical protein
MSNDNFSQIAFLPYAPIKEGFKIGDYEVWPFFSKEASERIKDKNVFDCITHHFNRYYEYKYSKKMGGYDKNIENIFMVSPTGYNFGMDKFTDKQIQDILSISHIIAFSAICECSFVSTSSDAFALYIQNFQPGSDGITLWNKHFTKLDMVKFMKPYHLDTSLVNYSVTKLSKTLGDALKYKDKPSINRILRVLELFFHTATNNEMVTAEHRLLSLVMCFEILLQFDGNKRDFMKKLEDNIDNYEPIMETRVLKNRNESISKSQTCWWAFDLYNLRNNIIHGNQINWDVERYGTAWTRIKFAGILIRKIIKKILIDENLWKIDFGDSILEVHRLDKELKKIIQNDSE